MTICGTGSGISLCITLGAFLPFAHRKASRISESTSALLVELRARTALVINFADRVTSQSMVEC
jgi:hypothetical protein